MSRDAFRDFVERVARGEVRHPVPEARILLGWPVVTDIRQAKRSSDLLFTAYGDELRQMHADGTTTTGGE